MIRPPIAPRLGAVSVLLALAACNAPDAREAEPVDPSAPAETKEAPRATSPDGTGKSGAGATAGAPARPAGGVPAGTSAPVARAATGSPVPADGWRENTRAATSNAGTYVVHYRPVAGAIEEGELFALEVWVIDPATQRLRTDVSLLADAAMPQHEHGMNREPRVTPSGRSDTGGFLVEGMLFHMLGSWELYLDVTHGAVTERTQFEVRLE